MLQERIELLIQSWGGQVVSGFLWVSTIAYKNTKVGRAGGVKTVSVMVSKRSVGKEECMYHQGKLEVIFVSVHLSWSDFCFQIVFSKWNIKS